jgi:hypothetical protein
VGRGFARQGRRHDLALLAAKRNACTSGAQALVLRGALNFKGVDHVGHLPGFVRTRDHERVSEEYGPPFGILLDGP